MTSTRKRIWDYRLFKLFTALVVLVALLAVAGVLLVNTDFFSDTISDTISAYYFYGTDYRLDIGRISGNPLSNLVLADLTVRYRGKDLAYDVLRIDKVELKYNLYSLLGDDHSLESLYLSEPHIWIKQDSTGINRIPGGERGGGGFTRFSVNDLQMSKGQIIYQTEKGADAIKKIELKGAVRSMGESLRAEIFSGSGEIMTRNISIGAMKGNIVFSNGSDKGDGEYPLEGLYLEKYSIRTGSSRVMLNGRFDPGRMLMKMAVDFSPLDVDEVLTVLDSDKRKMGRIHGRFTMEGKPDSLRVSGTADGVISGYALSDLKLEAVFEDSVVILESVMGGFNGAYVNGGGRMDFEEGLLGLDIEVGNLDLSKGFIPGETMPETDFNGRAGIGYYLPSGELSFDLNLEAGHFRRIPYETAVIRGVLSGDTLFARRARLTSATHDLDMRGFLAGKEDFKFYLDIRCDRGDTLFPYFGIEEYSADIDLTGMWVGGFDEWDLRLTGTCGDFVYRSAVVPEGDIKLAVEKADRYDVYFDMDADSCHIAPFSFNGLNISLEYLGDGVNIKNLELIRPDVISEMQGRVVTGGGETRLVFDNVLMKMFGEDWVSSGNFNISVNDSLMLFDDLQIHSKLGALYFDGVLKRFDDYFVGSLQYQRLDLSLLNRSKLLSIPLEGKAAGFIDCSGYVKDPDLRIAFELANGKIDTISVSSLSLKALYSDGHCAVDTLSLSSRDGSALAAGTIEGIRVRDLFKKGPEAFLLSTGNLTIEGRRLNLKPYLAYLGNLPFSDGEFTGTLQLSDSLAHPDFDFDGIINNIEFDHLTVPRIDLKAGKEGDDVKIEGMMRLFSSEQAGELSGNFPLKKNKWFYSLDRNRPFELNIDIPRCDIGDMSEMSDIVATAEGFCSVKFTAKGSVNDPDLSGSIKLSGANFRPAGMEERFRNVNAHITLEDTLLTIINLEGREGKDGEFVCSGTISLEGWKPAGYDITLDMNKVLVASIRDVMAIVSGRIEIGTARTDAGAVPSLTGRVEVNESEIYIDIGEMGRQGAESAGVTPAWIAEIDLDLKGSTRIKTPDANIELLGQATLHHNSRGTYLRGTLKLHRGWYNIYNNKFRISSGTLQFAHAGGFRPIVDIEAVTYDPEGKRIYLNIVWHQDDPQPILSLRHEDSGYSETDIWKMLGGGVVGSSGDEESGWDALGTAQNLAANYLERVLNSQMEGFTVSLEQNVNSGASNGMTGERETMLAIGKYLSEGLYVQFKQGLSVSTEREIEVEYRISDLFLIRSEIIKHSDKILPGKSLRSSDEINIDVKLRWEF